MKNVCMVAYTLYSSDGRVRREAETVVALAGHAVTVLTLREKDKARTFEMSGVTVKELDIGKYRGKSGFRYLLSYVRFTLLAFLECTKRVIRGSLDVVHVHNMPNFLVMSAVVPQLAGKPVILDVHDTMLETYMAKFPGQSGRVLEWGLRIEEAISCRMADHIVCVNDVQKAAMLGRKVPEGKCIVAMNVPDPAVFDHSKEIRPGPKEHGRFRMIYHGTVTKRVGVDQAIRAVASVNGKVPGLEFHIVGDGDDLEEFQELGKALGVEGTVCFHRRVPLEGLIPILEDMDLGVVPNGRNVATELMLPVKMLECIALGIPVIAPRLKTISHYFGEEMLFFFEPDDVASMAQAIERAFQSGQDRGNRAREARRFLEWYGWERHKKDFVQMYRDL